MSIEDLVAPGSVLCNAEARSKKHCLEILSELLAGAAPDVPNEEIFLNLVERERLGCTGLGKGTAFPHCRIDGLESSHGALVKLSSPIDFDTTDGELVDLVFGLMVPSELEDTHVGDVKLVQGFLDDPALRDRLRATKSSKQLYQVLIEASAAMGHDTSEPDTADVDVA